MRSRDAMVQVRVPLHIKERLERAAASRPPYNIPITQIVERGIILACIEIETGKFEDVEA